MNSTKKAKKMKNQRKLQRLQKESPLNTLMKKGPALTADPLVDSIDELKKSTPSMILASVLETCQTNIGGAQLKLDAGNEYIMPAAIFVSMCENAKKMGHKQVMVESTKRSFKQLFRRYDGENLDGKSLLIWRFGGIGDLLFLQPLVKHLKSTYPTCKVTLASAPLNTVLFSMWPEGLVDSTIFVPFNAKVLDAHDYHLTVEGSIERCKEAHEVCAIEIFKKMAGITFDNDLYPLELIAKDEILFKLYPYVPTNTVLIQARSTSPIRTYPIPLLRDLIERLNEKGHTVGILDQREASASIDDFILDQFFTYPDRVLNLARFSKDIQYMVAIQKLSKGCIGIDSAGVHISEALSKPTVGIYGPFLSKLRTSTYKHTTGIDTPEGWNECKRWPCMAHNVAIGQCPYIKSHKFVGCIEAIPQELIIEEFEKQVARHEE